MPEIYSRDFAKRLYKMFVEDALESVAKPLSSITAVCLQNQKYSISVRENKIRHEAISQLMSWQNF